MTGSTGPVLHASRACRARTVARRLWRIVKDFLHARVSTLVRLVAKQVGFQFQLGRLVFAATAMGIGGGEVQKEGPLVGSVRDETRDRVGHRDGIAAVAFQVRFEMINRLRCDVVFTDLAGSIPCPLHHARQRQTDHVVKRGELVVVMLMPKLAVAMVVQSAHHDTATGTAGGGGGKGVAKDHAICGDRIDRGCHRHGVAIAAQRRTFVIGDDEYYVSLRRLGCVKQGQSSHNGQDGGQRKDASHGRWLSKRGFSGSSQAPQRNWRASAVAK